MLGSENPERLADGLSRRGVLVDWRPGVVRISPHFFNTDEEVAQTMETLAELLGKGGLRSADLLALVILSSRGAQRRGIYPGVFGEARVDPSLRSG